MISTVQFQDRASQQGTREIHGRTDEILPRTRQRLDDAQAAFDRHEFTTCVVLLRVAIDTASHEVVGHIEGQTFVRMISAMAGVKDLKRIVRISGRANAVVHGDRNSYRHEAERMLRLIRVIGGRWCGRVFGELAGDV